MEGILKEVGLNSLIPQFSAERIEPANVAALTDEELSRLGVRTIGDRLRLRDLCTASEKERTRESVASNVLQERMALFNGRNSRRADRKRKAVAKRSWTVSFVCVIMGLSVVQNGKIPKFLNQEMLEGIFQKPEVTLSPSLFNLRKGLQKTDIYQICEAMPEFLYLFRQEECVLSVKMLTTLLKPSFSESGSNKRRFENEVYASFTKYLREVASGRRGGLNLGHVLQFVTGADEEPALGFELHPSMVFTEVKNSFIPTAHACSNVMYLPHGTPNVPLVETESLFQLYDYAFNNTHFGKM